MALNAAADFYGDTAWSRGSIGPSGAASKCRREDQGQVLHPPISQIATLLATSAPMDDWSNVTLFCKYTPDASVSGHDYDYRLLSGALDQGSAPTRPAKHHIIDLTDGHWTQTQALGQPRWCRMVLKVERSGSFEVRFEYRDDDREGDIVQRG